MNGTESSGENQFVANHAISRDIVKISQQLPFWFAVTDMLDLSIHHPTCVHIDLAAFRHNIGCVRSYCGDHVGVMAIVKANAYGHGALTLCREAEAQHVEYLGVARVEEALEIRKAGVNLPVLVFEITPRNHITSALSENIELTIGEPGAAESIGAAAGQLGKSARVHINVDTGMGRLGLPLADAAATIERILRNRHLELASVYSHLSTSEEKDKAYAREQLARFSHVVEELQKKRIEVPLRHMANSGAIISMPEAHLDMVRPGIMLYGYPPSRTLVERFPVWPVMSVLSTIAMIKKVDTGTFISYGRRFVAQKPSYIATVPAGYADGYSRQLTGKSCVLIRGECYNVAGTICMDHLMVDLGEKTDCEIGDEVVLLGVSGGRRITAWDIAETIGTIPYEITSLIPARVRRVFVERQGREKEV
jgi:alanine racemase